MNIEVIEKEELSQYENLILPYIYEELDDSGGELSGNNYLCLAASAEDEKGSLIPVSVLVMLLEANLDLAVLSIYTLPEYRRQGIGLKMVQNVTAILKAEGYDLSYIHFTGVGRWYEKLGYHTTLRWSRDGVVD